MSDENSNPVFKALADLASEIDKESVTLLLDSYKLNGTQGITEQTKKLVDKVFEDETQ